MSGKPSLLGRASLGAGGLVPCSLSAGVEGLPPDVQLALPRPNRDSVCAHQMP
jgi:hypothetical protein